MSFPEPDADDPDDFARNILDSPHPAEASEIFLESFGRVVGDMRSAALESFRPLAEHPELPRVLVPLLYNHHALLSRPLLDLLLRRPGPGVRAALEDLLAALPLGHPLRAELAPRVESLRARAGGLGAETPFPDTRYRSFLVAPDGLGSACAFLSKIRPDGRVAFLNFIANEAAGIKQGSGAVATVPEFERMLAEMERQDGWLSAEVSAGRVLDLARRAERDTFAAGREFPAGYLAWKWEAVRARETARADLERREAAFATLPSQAPRWTPAFADVFELFSCPCLEDWGLGGEGEREAQRRGERLAEGGGPRRLDESLVDDALVAAGVPEAGLPTWRRRLGDYAFVRWMRGEARPSRLALWAAESLTPANRLSHPFTKALALRSMGFLPKPRAERPGAGPSRGRPCPCGSGRKFKRCCGEGGRGLPAGGVESRLRAELAGFALRLPEAELEQAWRGFAPEGPALEQAAREDPRTFSIFLDWLLFGCRMGGKSALERFEAARGFLLDAEEAACLATMKTSRLAVFEVTEVRKGEGVGLKDLFTGEATRARDVSASRQLVRWDLLAAWVRPAPAGVELWGVALPFAPASREELKSLLEDGYRKLKAVEPLADWQRFLNASVPLLRGLQGEALAAKREALDNPATPEGDPVRFCAAVYAVSDFGAALKALRGQPRLEQGAARIGSDDRLESVEFDWLVPLKRLEKKGPRRGLVIMSQRVAADGSVDGRVGYAHFDLRRERLELETLSRERLAAARKLVESRLGGLVRLVEQSDRSPVEAGRGGDGPPSPDAERPERAVRIEAAAARRQSDRWLRSSIPMLGERTPMEAARDPEGRRLLETLLKEGENRVLRAGPEPESFDVAQVLALRRLLGLPEPEPGPLGAAVNRYRSLLEEHGAMAEDGPDPQEEEYRRAIALHKEGKLREAVAAYEALKDALRDDEMNFRLWGNLGVCLLALGQPKKAVPYFKTALEIRPDYGLARNNLAMAQAVLRLPPAERAAAVARMPSVWRAGA